MKRLLLPTLLALAGCHQSHASEATASPPGEVWITTQQAEDGKVTTAAVTERELGGVIVTSGKIAFDDLRVSHVFSPVTGRITNIEAQLGEHVKKGQSLVVIDSPDIGMISADLAKAMADVNAAEHDYTRQKTLQAIGAVAQKDYQAAEDNYFRAKAEMERAKQKARLLGTGVSGSQGFVLRSLIDGTVVSRGVNPGMEIQGQYSGGSPAVELFTIGDIDSVWVLADVFEMDLARVKVGEHAKIKVIAYPNDVIDGTLDWVSGTLDPTTRTAKVRCTLPNADQRLKPEMFATVSIAVPGKSTLAVARSAVLHMGDQTVVFLPAGSAPDGKLRFERRPVIVDEDEPGDYVPVQRGVAKGETVVSSGAILLSGV